MVPYRVPQNWAVPVPAYRTEVQNDLGRNPYIRPVVCLATSIIYYILYNLAINNKKTIISIISLLQLEEYY